MEKEICASLPKITGTSYCLHRWSISKLFDFAFSLCRTGFKELLLISSTVCVFFASSTTGSNIMSAVPVTRMADDLHKWIPDGA